MIVRAMSLRYLPECLTRMRRDKLADFRTNHLAPATAGENPEMAAIRGHEILFHRVRDAAAQIVRRLHLAGAGDVVQLTFDGKLRNGRDVLRTHQLAPTAQVPLGRLYSWNTVLMVSK